MRRHIDSIPARASSEIQCVRERKEEREGESALFVWLISHQPTILFYQNKPVTSNQPVVLFSQNKSAPAISYQPNEQTARWWVHHHILHELVILQPAANDVIHHDYEHVWITFSPMTKISQTNKL
jgi:hypothetical protein